MQVKEPDRKAEMRFTEYGRNELPAVGLTYLTPRQADADASALSVADAILSAVNLHVSTTRWSISSNSRSKSTPVSRRAKI